MKGFLRVTLLSLVMCCALVLNSTECLAQSEYYPVSKKIQLPDGGYNLNGDYRGIKVMMVNKALLKSGSTVYSEKTKEAVKKFQTDKKLVISGEVDLDTWLWLGYSESDWRELGVFTPPVYTTSYSKRGEIIAAVLKTAAQYCETETAYLDGAAGPFGTYLDSRGFLLECLYSAGICPDVNTYDLVLSGCSGGFLGLDEDDRLFSEGSLDNLEAGDVIFFDNLTLGIYDRDGKMYYMSFSKALYTDVSTGGRVKSVKRLYEGYNEYITDDTLNAVTGYNLPLSENSMIVYNRVGEGYTPSLGEICVLVNSEGKVSDVSKVQTHRISSGEYIIMANGKRAEWIENNINTGEKISISRDVCEVEKPDNFWSRFEFEDEETENTVKEYGPIRRFFAKIFNFFRRK